MMTKNKCNYVLKGLYNGVYGYTNDELTDKKAEDLIKKHRRGIELFAVLPKELQKKVDEKLAIEQKEIKDKRLKWADKVKADREVQTSTGKKVIESRKRDTMLDKQLKAEAVIKDALDKAESETKDKRKSRLNHLLSWDKVRLVKKAKSLDITSTGSGEELAKRIHKTEQ